MMSHYSGKEVQTQDPNILSPGLMFPSVSEEDDLTVSLHEKL